jgi:hypothetical protein
VAPHRLPLPPLLLLDPLPPAYFQVTACDTQATPCVCDVSDVHDAQKQQDNLPPPLLHSRGQDMLTSCISKPAWPWGSRCASTRGCLAASRRAPAKATERPAVDCMQPMLVRSHPTTSTPSEGSPFAW